MTAFRKMHGLGNDFVVFDARRRGLLLDDAVARKVADRRLGVGCDQVIVIEQANGRADAAMRIFNADGNEVEACGNAARCVARLLLEETDEPVVRLDTQGGLLVCSEAGSDLVTVDMGRPRLDWREIPLARAVDTKSFALDVKGETFQAAAVSMGNPHCVLFVDNVEAAPVAEWGPAVEHDALFPARTNVEFVQALSPERLRMRVWERGAGMTRACGTGACAAAVAAHRRGLAGRQTDVVLDGGTLIIAWRAEDDHVLMTGSASLAFTGDIDLGALESAP
jgi:diaminopimelate epimerase